MAREMRFSGWGFWIKIVRQEKNPDVGGVKNKFMLTEYYVSGDGLLCAVAASSHKNIEEV